MGRLPSERSGWRGERDLRDTAYGTRHRWLRVAPWSGFRVVLVQAAFARRMRRRRSAERSSSFSPPQVPYFSGRDTA